MNIARKKYLRFAVLVYYHYDINICCYMQEGNDFFKNFYLKKYNIYKEWIDLSSFPKSCQNEDFTS